MFADIHFIDFLRANPALAVFVTLALGFLVGKLRWRSFSLGTVTSVLLVGVVVGQLKIEIPEPAKTLFFLLFLFSVGYAVGPQFFSSAGSNATGCRRWGSRWSSVCRASGRRGSAPR